MASTPDYTILSSPRITEARFTAILRDAGSPSASSAAACYRAFVSAGVDPAVGLAVFRKESTYGKFGRANGNRSWGNLRTSPHYPTVGGFVRYPSWSAGAADCARLLAIYGRNQIRPNKVTSTVQTMPYVWAPAKDGNGPDRYGDQLASWIQKWSGQPGNVSGAPAGGGGAGKGSTVAYTGGSERVTVPVRPVFTETFGLDSSRKLDDWYAAQWVNFLVEARGTGGDSSGLVPWLNPGAADYQAQLAATTAALEAAIRPYVGTEYGSLPLSLDVSLATRFESDPMSLVASALGSAITEAATRAVMLAAILGLILLALYRLAKT